MMEGVKMFLSELGMGKYYDMFKIKGFDDESDIPYLTTFDLQETIMVTNQLDRVTILSHAHLYRPKPEHAVHAWLCSNSLSYYFIGFIQSELTDLKKIAQLSLPNEDLYDELEIVLPGHRKRLERAVQRLKLEQVNDAAAETPVCHGWWGKPECLPQAKFDFLCVKASLFSSHTPQINASIDFMVDSGSDVSTVQEDTLKNLNLDLIGPVYSCGIHGGSHTNLYKGRLKIGDQELDIEVLCSNYDSLGSRVVRHFRHIIDGHQHIWLKGNYSDPLPAIAPIEFPVGSSLLSQQSDRQQAVLPIAGVDDFEFIQGSLQQATRSLGSDHNGAKFETPKMNLKSTSTIRDEPHTEHFQYPHSGQSTSHIQSSPNKTSVKHHATAVIQEEILIAKKPHLTSHVLSFHDKQAAFSSKGKRSVKHISKGLIKTSLNRKHHSRPALSDTSVPRFSHGTGDKPQSFNNEVHYTDEEVASDPVESSAGISNSNVHLGERVSLCSILPTSLRDTDDDVDHLGKPFEINRAFTMSQQSQVYNGHYVEMTEVLNPLSDTQKESTERFVNASCENMSGSYCHHEVKPNGVIIDFNDVVHIDGLNIDSTANDDHSCSDIDNSGINREGNKLEMVFIPACNEIKEIQLHEIDMPVKLIKGDQLGTTQIHSMNNHSIRKPVDSGDSSYESPKKFGRFEQS